MEEYEEDLDNQFRQDHLYGLLERLSYSRNDERRDCPARHGIPINGDIYNGTATLKAAVSLYQEFCENAVAAPPSRQPMPNRVRIVRRLNHQPSLVSTAIAAQAPDLMEQHYEIAEGATGYPYDRIFQPYIDTAKRIKMEDAYLVARHQFDNLLRFCALAVRLGSVTAIELITGQRPGEPSDEMGSWLQDLRRDLQSRGVTFTWALDPSLHDRQVKFDNGWVVKIGRGLDIYQRPGNWMTIEAADFSMRKCRRTRVDIYREI